MHGDAGDNDSTHPVVAELPDVIGSAAGAAFGLVVSGPVGAITGAASGPAVAAALRYGADALNARRQRGGRVMQFAADQLAIAPDDLGQRAAEDPARLELLARVLEAAGHSTLEAKIPALGRVLAVGMDGETHVDEALVIASALGDLEAPHVQVLATIAQEQTGRDEIGAIGAGWADWQISDRLPGFTPLLGVLLRTLDRHALIRDITAGTYGGPSPRYVLTDLGVRILRLLEGEHDE